LEEVTSDLSRIVSLKKLTHDKFETVALKPILEETLVRLESGIKEKNLRVDIQQFSPLYIRGSKAYVQSIFYNLIENAIKYSQRGADSFLKIVCSDRNMTVRIDFIDNGVGIDLKLALNKIFKLYQRFNLQAPGKGLGLYLVKTQVDIMGGSISVESEYGKGSTFTLIFPKEESI